MSPSEKQTSPDSLKSGLQKSVLIVDDEQDIVDLLRFALERKTYRVFEASNGQEALDLIKKEAVDLVISDIRMPEMGGVALANRLYETYEGKPPPLIFVTSFSDLALDEAYDIGAEALFPKPLDFESIIDMVERSLSDMEQRWIHVRSQKREEVELNIDVNLLSLDKALQAKVLNIGRGGMYLRLQNPPSVGEVFNFCVRFRTGVIHVIEGSGLVRWCRDEKDEEGGFGIGVEFQSLTPQSQRSVLDLINHRRTRAKIPEN